MKKIPEKICRKQPFHDVDMQDIEEMSLLESIPEQNLILARKGEEKEDDPELRGYFDALTTPKRIYCQVFIATRNPLIACQAATGRNDDNTLYKFSNDPTTQTYIAEKLKKLMPRAIDYYKRVDASINYEQKIAILDSCLNELALMQGEKKSTRVIECMVKVVAELNKMQGHYAPQRHLALTSHLNEDELAQFNKLLSEYEKEY